MATRSAPVAPSLEAIDPVIRRALAEDLGGADLARGDRTSEALLAPEARAGGRLLCKAEGVLAGLPVFLRTFELLDPGARCVTHASDGDALRPGDVVAEVQGGARALLVGERTALNFVQRLSGVATLTAAYVERAGGRARILDTRKTTPGLRVLEKYAVLCGGGENHRHGLHDEVMIKNNHVDLAGGTLAGLIARAREHNGPGVRITAEARSADEALQAVRGGADVVLLDNMDVAAMASLCPRLRAEGRERGRMVEIEASGGIDLATVAAAAASGVDRVSVGALTHSAPALDLSFALEPLP